MVHSPPTTNEILVLEAIDASRAYDKMCAVRKSIPKEMQGWFDISEGYRKKHAAIEAVVQRMREDPTEEGLETAQSTSPSSDPT